MNMKIDQRLISWPRYSKYEIITAPNGSRYIRPTEESHPVPFHYVKEKERMVIDAVNVGMLILGKKSEAVIEKAVLEFVTKHGLLGLMTALPNSPDFMEYEVTFLPKNRFIRERHMKTDAYQKLFFPFHDLQKMRTKMEREPIWDDPEDHAEWQMMMYHSDQPEGVMMTALKEYAEPYDWVVDQLKDWAYMVSTTYVFYNDGFIQDLQLRMSLQEGMEAYGGIAPSYIILLREKPTLWWHFHSLHQCIHLTLSFMLADENNPLRMCKYCKKIYLAGTTEDEWFCSEKCKNAYEENGDK